jgi:uncharacterized membrane protein
VVLAGVVVVTLATLVVALPPGNPLVVPLAVLFVLVAPGYALVSALFPARRAARTRDGHNLDVRGLDFPERLALGVGTSIVVAPFVAFVLQTTVVGIARTPVLVLLGVGTLFVIVLAVLRWRALPPELRYDVGISTAPLRSGSLVDRVLIVVVALVVVVAVSSVGYATTTSRGGEDLTEFYVLAVQDDGTLLADNYPSDLEVGESTELYVGLDNHRGAETRYTVVGVVQEVDLDTGAVVRQDEFQRDTVTVADERSWGVRHEFSPLWAGVDIRVVYLLYVGDAPGVVSRESAVESVHIWMDVTDPFGLDEDATAAAAATGSAGAAPVAVSEPNTGMGATNSSATTNRSGATDTSNASDPAVGAAASA